MDNYRLISRMTNDHTGPPLDHWSFWPSPPLSGSLMLANLYGLVASIISSGAILFEFPELLILARMVDSTSATVGLLALILFLQVRKFRIRNNFGRKWQKGSEMSNMVLKSKMIGSDPEFEVKKRGVRAQQMENFETIEGGDASWPIDTIRDGSETKTKISENFEGSEPRGKTLKIFRAVGFTPPPLFS